VGITLAVLEGSSESPGAGLDVMPSFGGVVGVVEGSTESVVGCVAVALSVAEVGAVEESEELVVGLAGPLSVGVDVGAAVSVGAALSVVPAAVSVGAAVGETTVSVVVDAVELSATGAVASVVVATVSVAVSSGSLTVPPFQSAVTSFAILVTQFPTTEERRNNSGRCPRWWVNPLRQSPECSHSRELPE
jgi:hypothetical protein